MVKEDSFTEGYRDFRREATVDSEIRSGVIKYEVH